MPGGGRALGDHSLRHDYHLLNLYMGWFQLMQSGLQYQRDNSSRLLHPASHESGQRAPTIKSRETSEMSDSISCHCWMTLSPLN